MNKEDLETFVARLAVESFKEKGYARFSKKIDTEVTQFINKHYIARKEVMDAIEEGIKYFDFDNCDRYTDAVNALQDLKDKLTNL